MGRGLSLVLICRWKRSVVFFKRLMYRGRSSVLSACVTATTELASCQALLTES